MGSEDRTLIRAVITANPAAGAIGEVLLLPDRHPALHFVDDEPAGVEGGVPVGGGDADDDGKVTDFNGTGAVNAGGVEDLETLAGLVEDAVAFLFRE